MKVLFVTHSYPNYVPDLLLHGMRKIFGPDVVDYPRKHCLYEGVLGLGICSDDQRCPGWFPDDNGQIDRCDIWAKVRKGYFDWVFTDIRAVTEITTHLENWPKRCILIDGEDQPQKIPAGHYVVCRRETDGSDFSIPLPMALPEEILEWISRYDNMPKQYSIGFLGSTHDGIRKEMVEALANYYPNTLFQATAVPSGQDPRPKGRMGRDDYYRKLQQCRVVLSLAGAGWDTFRFWENAACNALHAASSFPLYIPDTFVDGHEIIRFDRLNTLKRKIDTALGNPDEYHEIIRNGRQKLLCAHTTHQRAKYLVDRLKRTFGH